MGFHHSVGHTLNEWRGVDTVQNRSVVRKVEIDLACGFVTMDRERHGSGRPVTRDVVCLFEHHQRVARIFVGFVRQFNGMFQFNQIIDRGTP